MQLYLKQETVQTVIRPSNLIHQNYLYLMYCLFWAVITLLAVLTVFAILAVSTQMSILAVLAVIILLGVLGNTPVMFVLAELTVLAVLAVLAVFAVLAKLAVIAVLTVLIFTRPGVAGAILQSPLSLTDSLTHSSFSQNIFKTLFILNRKS